MEAQQKPFNTINELTYNIDRSITLNFTDHIHIMINKPSGSGNDSNTNSNKTDDVSKDNSLDFQTFRLYFEKADILAHYCRINSKTDLTKSLGVYKDFEFIYMFKYNSTGGTSMLDIIYLNNTYSSYPIHINFVQVDKNKFIDYLTTYRDKYYKDLKIYNDKLHNINKSVDSLINNKKK
jgi:hypothetical protein